MTTPTHTRTRSTIAACLAVGALGLALAGCSASVSKTVSGDQVATLAEDSFEKEIGQRPEVECPDSIALKVDESTRCTLTDPSTGTQYGMTVLVKDPAADGSGLSFQVDDEPKA